MRLFCCVILFLILLCSACSYQNSESSTETTEETIQKISSDYDDDTPEYAVDCFLRAFKQGDFDLMKSFMEDGICYFDTVSAEKSILSKITLNAITENIKFNISDCVVNGENAEVLAEIENLYMYEIMMEVFSEYNMFNPGEQESAAFLVQLLSDKINIYKDKEKFKGNAKISLTKASGSWKVINDTAVFDVMTGEYVSFVSRDLKNFLPES